MPSAANTVRVGTVTHADNQTVGSSEDAADQVTEALRHDILAGVFEPGERLVELILCERYECKRDRVRTAIATLTAEGFIEGEMTRACVREVCADEARQITQVRAALERLTASEAATNASDADLARLEALIDDMQVAVDADDAEQYADLDIELHGLIRRASGHRVAAHLATELDHRAAHHRIGRIASHRCIDSLAEHRALVDAIVARDATLAGVEMERHLLSVLDTLETADLGR